MENLPEELKEGILLRLPVRSLLSLKCVSKSWRSKISNPNFVKLYLQLSNYSKAQYPDRILFVNSRQTRSVDINASFHNDSNTVNVVFPAYKPCTQVYAVGSCRGIVLLRIEEDIFLWNPVTGAYKNISLPPGFKLPITFAFCYDESLDDYFIGLSNYSGYPCNMIPEPFEVLSLRTNSWQTLNLTFHCRKLFQSNGTIFNGAIHFTADTCGLDASLELIAFDVTTKDLRKVPPPSDTNFQYPDLGVYKGCLALTGATTSGIFIWMMTEYGVQSSWTMLFFLPRYQSGIGFVHPFVFFKQGDEFVTSYTSENCYEGLSKWNDRGEMLEHRTYRPNRLPRPFIGYWTRAIAYTETLHPLP
ncbi:hypothetical protein K1719_033756 [Acacia pycnantha]|nr:hypothetical protein K1719_033756 [Acacia pycnantha]